MSGQTASDASPWRCWILGIGLAGGDAGAAPIVVWSGSHQLMRAALAPVLAAHAPEHWQSVDLTEACSRTRAQVFDRCPRVAVPLASGQAVLLHRHLLHGIAPWADGAGAPDSPRMVAWFRPLLPDLASWAADP